MQLLPVRDTVQWVRVCLAYKRMQLPHLQTFIKLLERLKSQNQTFHKF